MRLRKLKVDPIFLRILSRSTHQSTPLPVAMCLQKLRVDPRRLSGVLRILSQKVGTPVPISDFSLDKPAKMF
jgi:hypothetical protein